MKKIILTFLLSQVMLILFAQSFTYQGMVIDNQTQEAIVGAKVSIAGSTVQTVTDENGQFSLSAESGTLKVIIEATGYVSKSIQVSPSKLEFPPISLQQSTDKTAAFIFLTEEQLSDDDNNEDIVAGLLQSSKDVFMRRAAYDFGQAYFKPRGYDSGESDMLINGIPMNKVYNGRPQWSNWGGLNDVMRNQELTTGVAASQYSFGGLLGSTYVDVKPFGQRPGLRLSASASNRSYKGRIMGTYNSGTLANGLAYSISASRRWAAHKGYFDGTSYNAYSVFGSLGYKFNDHHSLSATAIFAPNKRGKNAVLTKETTDLAGFRYNPYWGWQGDKKRNSRMKSISEPIFILSYDFKKGNSKLSANLGYQFGKVGNTRIQYGNGQNPEPSYYKYMPSYFINKKEGAQWDLAKIQKDYFLSHKQMDWAALYRANKNHGESIYIISEDINEDKTLTGNLLFSTKLGEKLKLNAGITYRNLISENYAEVNDLLGGNYFLNKSYFTGKVYDTYGKLQRKVGDRYQYNYEISADMTNAFTQLQFKSGKFDAYAGVSYRYTEYQRKGLFNNEMQKNSFGKSATQYFYGISGKAGLTYAITGRHLLQLNAAYLTQPQHLRNVFSNARNSNSLLPNLDNKIQYTADASYFIRMPFLKMRLTGYFTQVEKDMETNFFFTQSAISDDVTSDFVSMTVKGIDKRHFGFEFGAEAQILPAWKATAAVAMGQYTYLNNPSMVVSTDEVDQIAIDKVYLKNYKVANGPQHAYSLGLEYQSPNFWWAGITANYLTNTYVDISRLYRTDNFFRNPDTQKLYADIDATKARELFTQEKMNNMFFLNLTAGKSWRVKGKYISLFASVNNLLNKKYLIGGFEQSRTANYAALLRDTANGVPTFGTRYFRGYGRTFFLNLAVSF